MENLSPPIINKPGRFTILIVYKVLDKYCSDDYNRIDELDSL